MKKLVLFFSIMCASGLTLVSIYNTVIDAQSWASDIPASIQTARDYFQHVDPRRFYAVAGPINVILILLTIVLFWKDGVIPDHLNQIRTAAVEWSHVNWLRTLLGLIGVLFFFKGLDTYYDCATKKT
jgi:hypothetical protein